jgi:catechol 2,3-dioxygenase-like lactoylglutathione lyase family enzyme
MKRLIAFVAATDLGRARAFYEGTLGLRVIGEEPFALVLDVDGTMLRVSRVDKVSIAPYTVLGWTVNDLSASIDELTQEGVVFERFEGFPQDERGVWTAGNGTRVAWFRDPDGNLLSLTQFR